MEQEAPVLSARNVARTYGRRGGYSTQALRGVSLEVRAGDFVGIMGPSGSGKTTLLNVLSGMDRPTSGSVEISGRDIGRMSDTERALFRRRHLGFVFQEFNLLDSLSVKENVLLPMILDKQEAGLMEARADRVMSLFGIVEIADKYPYEISGGEQQRTAVSRAVINDPRIVFADEPTGSLDSACASAVMGCLQELNRAACTVVVVTHDAFAASYCRRVVFLRDGSVSSEIAGDGPRQQFYGRILQSLEPPGSGTDDALARFS
jgi:putative ABC transport system ATP-binding protein